MTRLRTGAVAGALVLAGLATAPAAGAAPLELGTGAQSQLRLTSSTLDRLERAGVSLRPVRGARGIKVLRFPSTGGTVETKTARGTIRHRGALRLRRGGRTVTLSAPRVRFAATSTISFSTGGRRVAIAYAVSREGEVGVRGANIRVTQTPATLTPGGAAYLNRRLGTSAFRRGLRLGHLRVEAAPKETVTLRGGRTDISLEPAAAQALVAAGVRGGPVPPAVRNPDGTFGLPLSGRNVLAAGLQTGTVAHGGGLKLEKGATSVSLSDFLVVLDGFPTVNARLDYGRRRTTLLDIDLTGARLTASGATAAAGPIGLGLTQAAAERLNEAFGTALQPGQRLATATVRAQV